MNKNKKFLKEELIRYEEYLQNETPGTDEYEAIKDSYLSIYKELYSKKNVWDIVIDCLKIVVPAGVSVGLGIFAYHKNQDLESKDGDVWREARKR
nr:hypothetical protein [Catenibacterium mitsuokai]